MGKKIPFAQAEKLCAIKSNKSIFCSDNKDGYRINVNHPKIRPLYECYKRKIGEHILSNEQRYAFEKIIFKMLEKEKNQ